MMGMGNQMGNQIVGSGPERWGPPVDPVVFATGAIKSSRIRTTKSRVSRYLGCRTKVTMGNQSIMAISEPRTHRQTVYSFLSLGVVLGVCLGQPAFAGLGDTVASVQRDHSALRGTALTVTPMASYDVHEITTAESRVREYVSRDGNVFAVTWSGRARPDLSVVLGTRYAGYTQAAGLHRGNHKVFALATDDLVMHVTKLPRGFAGEAHAPTLLPAGVTARDIR